MIMRSLVHETHRAAVPESEYEAAAFARARPVFEQRHGDHATVGLDAASASSGGAVSGTLDATLMYP